MTEIMKSILTRVLSQEIANQEKWKAEDEARNVSLLISRDEIIDEVRSFMKENDIEFSWDWYFSA